MICRLFLFPAGPSRVRYSERLAVRPHSPIMVALLRRRYRLMRLDGLTARQARNHLYSLLQIGHGLPEA